MTLEEAKLLYQRANKYYKISEIALKESFYDVCATTSHISAELFIKSTFLLLGREPPYYSFHNLRKMLSELSIHVPEIRGEVLKISKEKRRELKILDQCRSDGQYSKKEVNERLAFTCFNVVHELIIPLIEKIWKIR